MQVIEVYDGGSTIITHNGNPANVGVIHLRVTKGEATPETITGYCRPNHKESIIKYLGCIVWAKPEDKEQIKPKIVYTETPDYIDKSVS